MRRLPLVLIFLAIPALSEELEITGELLIVKTAASAAALTFQPEAATSVQATMIDPSLIDANAASFWGGVGVFDTPGSERDNVVYSMGYNLAPGGGRVDSGEPSMGFQFETFYQPVATPFLEFHIEMIDTGALAHRLLSYKASRDGEDIDGSINADIFNFYDSDGLHHMKFNWDGEVIGLVQAIVLQHGVNGTAWLQQLNAANDGYVSLIYLDSNDTVQVGATSGVVQVNDIFAIVPQATAPATCAAAKDIYSDTSGALCFCATTNTWEKLNSTGACA